MPIQDNSQSVTASPMLSDFSDTGMWRLFIILSPLGMQGWLAAAHSGTENWVSLFQQSWDFQESQSSLLAKIENCVYDNPRLLDDYSTDIVLLTPYTTVAPTSYLEQYEDEETIMSSLFPLQGIEVQQQQAGDMTFLFSIVPGLMPFLRRTLPGSRIQSASGLLYAASSGLSGQNIIVDNEAGFLTLVAVEGPRLHSLSTRVCNHPEDISYFILHSIHAAGFSTEKAKVVLTGSENESRTLKEMLSSNGLNVEIWNPQMGAPSTLLALAKDKNLKIN